MRFTALPGFRDVHPDAFARRRRIFGVWREVASRYGFEEYDGPPLEPLELYTSKSGPEIVEQLYHFTDRGGREVALRPEMTPTLARLMGERAAALRKPIRWFSVPQLFRYERQQRGRLREHFQLNVDIIGEPGPAADAEVIAVAIDIVRGLGFGPGEVRVRLSDRRVLAEVLTSGLGVLESELAGVLAAFDRYERSKEAAEAALEQVFAGDSRRAHEVRQFAAALGDPAPLLEASAAEPLKACLYQLEGLGLGEYVDVDFRIVRGLAYYTGVVFELFDAKRSLRAICGGGRYDTLIQSLGGPDLPCVGFGMGDVVLGELLADRDGPPRAEAAIDVFLVLVREEERAALLALAAALRARGVRVEYALKKQALGKQLELAGSRGAGWAVIIGPDEYAAGKVKVRALRSGTEATLGIEEVRTSFQFTRTDEGSEPVQ
jgi:histidyl-tRNA synthetase